MKHVVAFLAALVVAGACACACGCSAVGLLAVGEDIGKIAAVVYADVVAHKPFAQVLADTGTDDAALLAAILTAVASDPKLSASDRAACWAACKPYIDQANAMTAAKAAAKQ